jgi:hypothetical protein
MSDNKNEHVDDPRLTAYALDQLVDSDRAEIEQLLEQSPEAREAVEEIRRISAILRKSKLAEPTDAASESLRDAVEAKLDAATPKPAPQAAPTQGRSRSNILGLVIAAGLLIGLTVGVLVVQDVWSPRQRVANVDPTDNSASKLDKKSANEEPRWSGRSKFGNDDIKYGAMDGKSGGREYDDNLSVVIDQSQTVVSAENTEEEGTLAFRDATKPGFLGPGSSPATGGFDPSDEQKAAEDGGDPFGSAPSDDRTARPQAVAESTTPGDPLPAEPAGKPGERDRFRYGRADTGGHPVPPSEQPLGEAGPDDSGVGNKNNSRQNPGGFHENGVRPGQGQGQGRGRGEGQGEGGGEGQGEGGGDEGEKELEGRPIGGGVDATRPNRSPQDGQGRDERARDDEDKDPNSDRPDNSPSDKPGDSRREKPEESNADPGRQGGGKDDGRLSEDDRKPASEPKPKSDPKEKQTKARKVKKLVDGWRRSRKLPNTSRLMIGDREELPLQGMQVNVQIDGFRARVLLDMYYLNTHQRQLEGNFQLRLPNEASLYFFAFGETAYSAQGNERPGIRQAFYSLRGEKQLGTAPAQIMQARADTWKAPKEARMVTRTKAAHAYRETVRRRVDPALVEWAGAGIFSARVFPLVPRKLHRIVIGYDVNLLRLGDDLVYRLDLPDSVGECTVDLNVAAKAGKEAKIRPEVRPFTAAGRAYFHYERPEYRQFEVRMVNGGNTVIHGADPETGPFFAASFQPNLPKGGDAVGAERAVFLVDTSLSSNPEKFNVWLSLLKATLSNNRDAIKQFAVLFFNIEQHWWQEKYIDNTAENVAALTEYCNTLALEGATDVGGALRAAAVPSWQPEGGQKIPRDYFLLSDGAITWGERDLHLLTKVSNIDGSVFAYRTGLAGTDIDTLSHLMRETGGAVFTVVGDEQVEAASKAHRKRPWQLVDVNVEGGSDFLLAGQPRTLFAGQQLLLVGRGIPAETAKIALRVRRGNERKTVNIKFDQVVDSDLASRLYGHISTMGLEDLGAGAYDVSAAYSRHFRITGRTCSLLMLESEADYQRFNIKPQDDAFVVKSTEATSVIASVGDKMAAKLGDPKASFVAWMHKLQSTPGLAFQMSPALKVAMDAMPAKSFAIHVDPLKCNERTWEPIAEPLREMLSVRNFGYTEIMKEAQRRRTDVGAADALKALSSLVEYRPGDLVLARDVGFSALDWGLGEQAYHLLRRVAEARPYEPQTYLAIAHCLAGMDRADLAMIYYEVALGAKWANRFPDFKQIASVDYLHFLRKVKSGKLQVHGANFAAARLESLTREVNLKQCDLLVTIMWNTDGTDVDMHVIEPSGEECYYQHRTTKTGGHITRDVTEGYGPEMYRLRKAPAGEYKIRAKYFSSDQNRLSARTRVFATVYENWGTDEERVERRTVTLDTSKQMTDILTVKK